MLGEEVHWYWASRTQVLREWLPVELASVPVCDLKPWYRIKLRERGEYWASKQPFYLPSDDPITFLPVPEVSTTAAIFQVMEKKRGEWDFMVEQTLTGVMVWMYDALDPARPGRELDAYIWQYVFGHDPGCNGLAMREVDYDSRTIEQTIAWAVCCCVWMVYHKKKGKQNEARQRF
jgi:hypothetical protein